jgi:O-succinylbenzoic acid--CoA ligase
MDAAILTSSAFWLESTPIAAGEFPGKIPACPPLRGHVLFATSGSSGTPKWIALSKTALLASATAVNRHLNVTSASCWGLALPPHHVGGFGVAARAFAADCEWCAFAGRWDATAFAAWLAANRVTHTSLVPTQIHDLVAARLRAPASLRAIVVGGGHLDTATGQAARALGWPVLASYGMTEAASQIATQGLDSLHTLYQPAPLPLLPIWQAQSSPEHLLRIAGPALFSGLLARENEQWIFIPRAAQWYQTHDRALLANSELTVIGRADTLVKVLGELVDPEIIEREIVALAAGKLVPGSLAVIAVPDARAEHTLVPVFDGSVDTALIAAVLTDYARQAPGFRRLLPPVILHDFPHSLLGKARRKEIAAAILSLPTLH